MSQQTENGFVPAAQTGAAGLNPAGTSGTASTAAGRTQAVMLEHGFAAVGVGVYRSLSFDADAVKK